MLDLVIQAMLILYNPSNEALTTHILVSIAIYKKSLLLFNWSNSFSAMPLPLVPVKKFCQVPRRLDVYRAPTNRSHCQRETTIVLSS